MRAQREECNSSISLAYECRDPVPHSFIPSLKAKDIGVPFRCFLDIADGESYVINSFELHEQREYLNRRLQRFASPLDRMGANWSTEAFKDNFAQVFE